MHSVKENPKKYSGLWCGKWKRPSAFIMFNCVGHLKAAFLFNILKIKHYDCKNQFERH